MDKKTIEDLSKLTRRKQIDAIENEMGKRYLEYKEGKITGFQFNKDHDELEKIAELCSLPFTKKIRMDNRLPNEFYDNIYNKSYEELEAIEKHFISYLRDKGHEIKLVIIDKKRFGMPRMTADDQQDYILYGLKNGEERWRRLKVDSKTFKYDIIFLKDNNLQSYSKYNAAIFLITDTFSVYLPKETVEKLKTLQKRPCRSANGKFFLYGGKEGIEISDRSNAHVSLETLIANGEAEVWEKGEENVIWTGPLENWNGGKNEEDTCF